MTNVPDAETQNAAIPLWNPNAAANWSLLFSPIFGAYLHALNWRALGEHERANASLKWVYGGAALLAFYLLIGMVVLDERTSEGTARAIGTIFCSRGTSDLPRPRSNT